VAGIYDLYGPCNFSDPFWNSRLPHVADKLPPHLTPEFISKVFDERPVPIKGGVSLEGQQAAPPPPGAGGGGGGGGGGGPNFNDPRVGYAMTQIGNGTVMEAIMPSKQWDKVDPLRNVSAAFPPTFIAHGDADNMVPLSLSRDLLKALQDSGVRSELLEVPGEGHTFAGKMRVGSQTYELQRKGFDFLESLIAKD